MMSRWPKMPADFNGLARGLAISGLDRSSSLGGPRLRRGTGANGPNNIEKVPALRANRRSFDCASRDETARGSAQDDNFYINPSLKSQAICRYTLERRDLNWCHLGSLIAAGSGRAH
jgi:hypothetical protein